MSEFTHFDQDGNARMVNLAGKQTSLRTAVASGMVRMQPSTLKQVRDQTVQKGDVLGIARTAAIMAAKRTSELIPLCHPLRLDSVTIEFSFLDSSTIKMEAMVSATERTGVEMEALTAVSVAALTIYDMCKSSDKKITISEIRLEQKLGGKSGLFTRQQDDS
jgi:cyclic pyranopterin phosphate synthase